MIEYIYIPGLRYSGETEDQAQHRERLMEENNAMVREMRRRNKLPMVAYREWAKGRGFVRENL